MPEHGEYDPKSKQWFCSYWMSKECWLDMHHYAPPNAEHKAEKKTNKNS
jgi:hypothetical protein